MVSYIVIPSEHGRGALHPDRVFTAEFMAVDHARSIVDSEWYLTGAYVYKLQPKSGEVTELELVKIIHAPHKRIAGLAEKQTFVA